MRDEIIARSVHHIEDGIDEKPEGQVGATPLHIDVDGLIFDIVLIRHGTMVESGPTKNISQASRITHVVTV